MKILKETYFIILCLFSLQAFSNSINHESDVERVKIKRSKQFYGLNPFHLYSQDESLYDIQNEIIERTFKELKPDYEIKQILVSNFYSSDLAVDNTVTDIEIIAKRKFNKTYYIFQCKGAQWMSYLLTADTQTSINQGKLIVEAEYKDVYYKLNLTNCRANRLEFVKKRAYHTIIFEETISFIEGIFDSLGRIKRRLEE